MDSDAPSKDELFFEDWDLEEEELAAPRWRRPLIIGIALVTVVAMAVMMSDQLANLILGMS